MQTALLALIWAFGAFVVDKHNIAGNQKHHKIWE